jgi:hypothetical protein
MTDASKANDPRDRLFALLGLACDIKDEELHFLRPDYDARIEEVICRYASVLVQKGHVMVLLYRGFLRPASSRIPSWTPDWTSSVNPGIKRVLAGCFWS